MPWAGRPRVGPGPVGGHGVSPEESNAPGRHNGYLYSSTELPALLDEVAARASAVVPGVDGAGVLVLQDDTSVMAWSNAFARSVDDWQYSVGEGPCVDALDRGETLVLDSTSRATGWTRFVPRAHELGLRSALSVPLRVAGEVVGSLNLYSRREDQFDADAVRQGELFARPAASTLAVLGIVDHAADAADVVGLELQDVTVVARAVGVLLAGDPTLTVPAARARLVSTAQEQDVAVVVLARRIVSAVGRSSER
ncbi:MAG: GAF domain-containing protein [Propionibacteriaceae bacterium]|nr:MAG: GAF domain-containing protein [Propionibacteriaceae bacterium]